MTEQATVRVLGPEEVHRALGYEALVAALRQAFATGCTEAPVRMAYAAGTEGNPAHLLTMPAWRRGATIGVKLVTVLPGNTARGRGTVNAIYVLFNGATGAPQAIVDGEALTNRRTAAASALASTYLSRPDAQVLLVVGTGHLAPHLVAAHCAVRPIRRVLVWGRSAGKSAALAASLRSRGCGAEPVADLPGALAQADIVSSATTSTEPLILGRHVRPGTHIDLVGAFTAEMRESDDDLVAMSRVFVDTRAGALAEAGDLVQPMRAGLWSADLIQADLHALCAGSNPGRTASDQITLFKSVGAAIEDLIAAEMVAQA